MDSYRQWQISQSDCKISCNCGKTLYYSSADGSESTCINENNIAQTCLAVTWKFVHGITYPKTDKTCVNLRYPTCFSSFSRGFHLAHHLCFANCHQLEKLRLRSVPEVIGGP